jgi:excisionase family DNA binding protein
MAHWTDPEQRWSLRGGMVGGVSTADITWLNTVETARRLGVTPRTLYRFIDDGKLPAYRFGRVIRLKESEVAEFIESCRITPGTLDAAGSAEELEGLESVDSPVGDDRPTG